ncbi:MAG: Regulatory protein, MerR, partial [Candidatus Roizmanbacteria bacterium GW2011_GWA2_37_7]
MGKTKKLLSIGAAAKIIGVSIDTLRNWDESGTFPSIREDGKIRRYDQKQVYIRARARLDRGQKNGLILPQKTKGQGFIVPPPIIAPLISGDDTYPTHSPESKKSTYEMIKNIAESHFFQNKSYRYLSLITAGSLAMLIVLVGVVGMVKKPGVSDKIQYLGATDNRMSELEKRLSELETSFTQPIDSETIQNLPIPGHNLIRNSSFEAGNGVAPRQWHYQLESDTSNTFRSDEGIHSGKAGLKIIGGGDGRYGISQPTAKTKPGSTYTLSAYVKQTNLSQPARIMVGFWDEYGNKRGKQVAYTLSGTRDWYRINMTVTTPGLVTDLVNWFPLIEIDGLKSGQVYVDDVMLEESSILNQYESDLGDPSGTHIGLGDGGVLADPDGNYFQ